MNASVARKSHVCPSSFRQAAVARSPASRGARSVSAQADPSFDRDWLNKNPLVPVLGFFGWTVPSSIPVGAFNGDSLFGLFTKQIGTELAKFPTGPGLDSPFWLYLVTWHVGLFVTMFLGQIGVQGRKQGYFSQNIGPGQ